jgi:hypothetical protein
VAAAKERRARESPIALADRIHGWLAGIDFDCLHAGAVLVRLDHEQVLECARQAIRDGRGDPPKCSELRT